MVKVVEEVEDAAVEVPAVVPVMVVEEGEEIVLTDTVALAKCKAYSTMNILIRLLTFAISDSEKKVAQGWGGDDADAELKAEEGAAVDAAVEGDAWGGDAAAADDAWGGAATPADDDPWAAPNASDEPAVGVDDSKAETRRVREREQDEEDNTLTLDQYLAKKAEQEASLVPKLEGVRQANEGGDDSLWKDAVPLQRNDDEDAYFVGKVSISFTLGI